MFPPPLPQRMTSVHSPAYQFMLRRLRQARQKAELTQSQVAERLGRSQSFVSKIESGERKIDPIELLELARVYGHGVDFFLPGSHAVP